jgi:UPF0755 protein
LPALAHLPRKAIALGALALLGLLLAALGARQWVLARLEPVNPGAPEKVQVAIPPGASTQQVADLLYDRHLIRDPLVFRYYARYRGLDSRIMPGEYELSPSMNPDAILEKLTKGQVVVYRFTVPEGLTVSEMAELLASRKVVDRDRFLEAARNSQLSAKYLPEDAKLEQPLEGYLFPATYEYKPGVKEEEILRMMFDRFEQVWTPELKARAQELGLTVHQVVTLASIVEKEARVAKERAIIAGVYHNRLKIGMKLDADPTVRYAVKKPPKDDLLAADLEVESPYNTYKVAGLPPGPIAAPGEDSIRAVLYPESHDFWYFVAKGDGSGEHYFARTLDEQTQNIARARENEKK